MMTSDVGDGLMTKIIRRHDDDETLAERREQGRRLRISDGFREFAGVLAVADHVNENKVSYTAECLQKAAERWKKAHESGHTMYGSAFTSNLDMPVRIQDISFEVKEVEFLDAQTCVQDRRPSSTLRKASWSC